MRQWIVFLGMTWAALIYSQEYLDDIIDDGSDETYSVGQEYARITFAERYVRVLRADEYEDAVRNYPIVSGDIMESNHGAFSEIQFIDGTSMQIDGGTQVEFQAINEVYADESLSVIKLFEGSLFFHMAEPLFDLASRVFRIDTRSGSVYLESPGIYRIDYEGKRLRLKVYRGVAEISGMDDSVLVRSGQYAAISNGRRPGHVRPFNSFHGDKFESWAYGRSLNHDGVSSRYVSGEIAQYANDLDGSGEWRYEPDINIHVWVPQVSMSWRPYYNGYWTSCGSRLTWVSYDPFGWVTHHYGSWGWHASWGWYWIPGRLFSPAWVAWTAYDDFIGWCPLGYWRTPYYYDRYYNPIRHIFNHHHHHHHWYYMENRHIRHRHPTRVIRMEKPRARRKVTTRPIHVTRAEYAQPRTVTRVIRDPETNRSRAVERRQGSSELRSGMMRDGQTKTRVKINSRNSGTEAVSRVATPKRRTNGEQHRERVHYEGRRPSTEASTMSRTTPKSSRTRSAEPTPQTPSRQAQPNRNTDVSPTRSGSDRGAPRRSEVTRQKPAEKPSTNRTPSQSTTPKPRSTTPPKRSNSSSRQSNPPKGQTAPKSTPKPKKIESSNSSRQNAAAAPRPSQSSSAERRFSTPPAQRSTSKYSNQNRNATARSSNPQPKTQRSAPEARRSSPKPQTQRSAPAARRSSPKPQTQRSAPAARRSSPKPQTQRSAPTARRSSPKPQTRKAAPVQRTSPQKSSSRPTQSAKRQSPKKSVSSSRSTSSSSSQSKSSRVKRR